MQRIFKIIFQHLNLIIASLVLSFRKDVGDAILDACSFNSDDEAMMLMRVAKLVCKEIFGMFGAISIASIINPKS